MQGNPWHVLHVRSNFEKRVAEHLTVRAVEHYLPLYRERVRWSDRTIMAERPLFTGYVFARIVPETRIVAMSTPGVVRSLGDDNGSLVSCEELERIRAGLTSGLLLRPHPHLSVGTRVRVRRGVFEDVEGVVAEFRQQCRVIIALAQLRRCFSLEVEIGDVEVVNPVRPPNVKKPVVDSQRGWAVFSAFGD